MSDKTDFSLNIAVDPATGFEQLPDWVAFDLCKAYRAPGGNLLLHNTRTGKRAMVMPEVYATLLSCKHFRTLDQHVAKIIDQNPGMQGQQADIRNVLKSMLDSGIMVSAKKISAALKRKAPSETEENDPNAPVVAIITWERPQALERLLTSIAANCRQERVHHLYVIDDSRETENIRQNQALVERFAAEIKIPLRYFGQDEQQSLLNNLAARLPEHERSIRFLADQSRWRDHWTSGLARNLALLLSVGRRLVMMDDDSLCDVYYPQQPKPDISFSDDPRDADFFASKQEWAIQHQPLNPDPIGRHMQCLGLTFSQALEVLGQGNLKPAGFSDATALLTSELHPDSPVLVTECGAMGCPGTEDNTWLPDMATESLKRLLASTAKVNNALNSRLVWSGRHHPHFAPRPNISVVTGFDNRQMLPPYFPIIRGEDRLFGNMLDFIFPSGVTLDYPWAVPHLPIPGREWRKEDLDFTPPDSFPLFFFEQVIEQKSNCLASSPAKRLGALSGWFNDLASASHDSLAAMYRDTRLRATSEQLQHLGQLLDSGEAAPDAWKDYLTNGIEQLNVAMDEASRGDLQVKGLPADKEGPELTAFWKETWGDFGSALNAWPEIRRAAADIINPTQAA